MYKRDSLRKWIRKNSLRFDFVLLSRFLPSPSSYEYLRIFVGSLVLYCKAATIMASTLEFTPRKRRLSLSNPKLEDVDPRTLVQGGHIESLARDFCILWVIFPLRRVTSVDTRRRFTRLASTVTIENPSLSTFHL